MSENEQLSRIERSDAARLNTMLPSMIDLGAPEADAHYTLHTFWNVILKHRWTVISATIILTVVALIVSLRAIPIYEATGHLEVEPETGQILSLNDLYRESAVNDYAISTQVEVLQSATLAWMTIQQLGLQNNADFVGGPIQKREGGTKGQLQERTNLVSNFQGNLRVEQVKDSRILSVAFDSPNPNLAAQVVNALIQNFIEYTFRQKYDATRQATQWMGDQLDELRAKVEKSQEAMVEYERKNLIVSLGGSGNQTVAEQKLAAMAADLTAAQSDLVQKESFYNVVKSNEDQVAFLTQDLVLQNLENRYNDLKAEYVDALSQYGPNYPKVVRLRLQLNEVESLIKGQRKQIVEKVRNEYLAALGREKLLQASVAKQQEEVGRLSQLMIQHNILRREYETNQQLYDNLLQHLKNATVSAGLKATNVHMVDPATPPTSPIRPHKTRNVAVGMLVGLILGVTLAFVQEAMDSSVRTTEEAERLISAPALAVIPIDRDGRRPKALPANQPTGTAPSNGLGLVILKKPSSPIAESYRSLRTSVLLSTAPHPPRTLLVTSAQVGEGKTSTSLNLAIAFAQRGGPVLIIDADLRRPSVAKSLGVASEKGLSSYLTGAHSLDEVLIQYESVPNLWILPAGPRPPDPAELLSSATMESTLKTLLARFSQIVVDSPPLLLVTDAVVLSPLVDGVILVVASGVTARGALTRAHRILENAGTRVLGMVLNKVDMRFDTYYGSYYGAYSRAYSDSYYYEEESSSSKGAGGIRSKLKSSKHRV